MHLQAIACAVVTICSWKMGKVGAVLAQQRIRCKVCAKAARCDDDGAMLLECLAVLVH